MPALVPTAGSATGTVSSSSAAGQVDTKFIALAIALTFVFTAIVVTLLVLALVWLFLTWKKKKSDKHSQNNLQLSNPNYKSNGK